MKKIFIVLVVALTFIGCSKPEREVYAEFELLSNPESCYWIRFQFYQGGCVENNSTIIPPIPVGTTCVSPTYLLEKGTNANASVIALTPTGASPNTLEYKIKFYVDGNLEETRIESYTSQNTNFIVP
jgi:hypothetical protein